MKIVQITTFYPPYHLGGGGVHVYKLSNLLAKEGHTVFVITTREPFDLVTRKKKKHSDYDYPNHKNIRVIRLSSRFGKIMHISAVLFGYSFWEKKIKKIVNEIQPDIIHYHNIVGFPRTLKINGKFKVFTSHDYLPVCPKWDLQKFGKKQCKKAENCFVCQIKSKKVPVFWRLFRNNMTRLLSKIDYIITPSKFMLETLKEFGIQNNCVQIYNFIENHISSVDLNNKIKKSHEKPFFLYVGRLEKEKGIDFLLEKIENLQNKDYQIIITGIGNLQNKIQRIANNSNETVKYLGWVSEDIKQNLLKNAIALLIPSIWSENCPMTILDSFAFGLPVIASQRGGNTELVIDNYNGFFIDLNKPEVTLDKMFNLYNNKKLEYLELCKNCLEQFNNNFSSRSYLEKYFNLYNNHKNEK